MSSILAPTAAARAAEHARPGLLGYLRRVDWLLVGAVVAIAVLGLNVIGGATRDDIPGNPSYYVDRQVVFLAVGGVLAVVAMAVPPGWWRRVHWPLSAITLALIALVMVAGTEKRGSQRWIDIGPFEAQPSELGKLVVVLGLAAILASRREQIGSWVTTILGLAYLGVFVGLVFLQPDLGTALVFAAAGLGVLFVAGIRWTHFAILATLAVLAGTLVLAVLPAAGVEVIKPYQYDRLTQFLHPDENLSDEGYNLNQARIAVGSGGLAGRGVDQATQTNNNFLPEHHTDFIFATLGEQRGFIGAALLLGLYLVVLWRILRAVTLAETFHGSLLAGGVAVWLLFSIFVNVGMTIGLAPVTGIPLPLMSYGGSSTLVILVALGIVQSVQLRGRLPAEQLDQYALRAAQRARVTASRPASLRP